MTIWALIPARAGSKRVPGKNTGVLNGHPLLAYSIAAAGDAKLFHRVWVSTDSRDTCEMARRYGAEAYLDEWPRHRDDCRDIEWIQSLFAACGTPDAFAILRPTSPFRTGANIQAAWSILTVGVDVSSKAPDSVRAVRPVSEHPGKMWINRGGRLLPLLPFEHEGQPWHSNPTQVLPKVYVQTSALEMAWTAYTVAKGTIAGEVVAPLELSRVESLSIDTDTDWLTAEKLMASPSIQRPDPSKYRV